MIGLSRIQRYIFRRNLRFLLAVLGVIVLAILLVDTVEQLNTVGSRVDIGLDDAFFLAAMKLPTLIEQTLPFTLLIAAMLTFRQLSQNAELPVIRASGLSAWGFLLPTILLATLTGLVTMMVISPIGSGLTADYEARRAALLNPDQIEQAQSSSKVWLRDGTDDTQTVIYAEEVDEAGILLTAVKFLQEDKLVDPVTTRETYRFARRIEAASARLEPGTWHLTDVTEYVPGQNPRTFDSMEIPTRLQQAALTSRFTSPRTISFWSLPAHIAETRRIGISTSNFEMRWYSLTALPFMFVAMALIGALACLRLIRLGSTAPFIAFGTGSAIILFFVSQLGSSFGTTGAVPPFVAALAPPIFAVFVCLALVAFREDG